MTAHWTTEDIARELHLVPPGASSKEARAAARDCIRRWRRKGIQFTVRFNPETGQKEYLPGQIRAARAQDRQGARTDLQKRT